MRESVQVVLMNDDGHILAVSRKDDHEDFSLPGGKRDDTDATLENALIREVKEETGLDISDIELFFMMPMYGYQNYTYIAKYSGEIYTDEPHVIKWCRIQDIVAVEGKKMKFGYYNFLVMQALQGYGLYELDYTE